MNKNQQKEKTSKSSALSNLLIILLIAIIMVTSSIGIFAWAKYTSATDGNATAQVAKWSFKVVDGVPETSDVIEFAVTRTDGYEHVEEGKLAPGTFGEFQIGIDATGTETVLTYTIEAELTNKPTNLKLYADSAKQNEIKVVNDRIIIEEYLSLEQVKEVQTKTIYWEWPYETGDLASEIVSNDAKDTIDAGKTMTMVITVTGTEVLEEPQYLADVVSVGDYVNYNAADTVDGSVYSYTSNDCLAGSSISGTFSSSDSMKWRVLSVNKEAGTVELMSADTTAQTVTLSWEDGNGYKNGVTVLNDIGAVYGNGKGASGGRSINVEDIEQHFLWDKTTFQRYAKYGDSKTYTLATYIMEDGTKITATDSNPVIMTQTYYANGGPQMFNSTLEWNMICADSSQNISKKYWLASRCIDLANIGCGQYIRYISNGVIDANSDGTKAVTPVVSLRTNIQTSGQDESGAWNIIID